MSLLAHQKPTAGTQSSFRGRLVLNTLRHPIPSVWLQHRSEFVQGGTTLASSAPDCSADGQFSILSHQTIHIGTEPKLRGAQPRAARAVGRTVSWAAAFCHWTRRGGVQWGNLACDFTIRFAIRCVCISTCAHPGPPPPTPTPSSSAQRGTGRGHERLLRVPTRQLFRPFPPGPEGQPSRRGTLLESR